MAVLGGGSSWRSAGATGAGGGGGGGGGLTTVRAVAVLAVVVGCLAVLWPKIFYPMMLVALSRGPEAGDSAEYTPPPPPLATRGPMAGRLQQTGKRTPAPHVRMAAPGPQPMPKGAPKSSTFNIIMPIYTLGIIVLFVYMIFKIMSRGDRDKVDLDRLAYNEQSPLGQQGIAGRRNGPGTREPAESVKGQNNNFEPPKRNRRDPRNAFENNTKHVLEMYGKDKMIDALNVVVTEMHEYKKQAIELAKQLEEQRQKQNNVHNSSSTVQEDRNPLQANAEGVPEQKHRRHSAASSRAASSAGDTGGDTTDEKDMAENWGFDVDSDNVPDDGTQSRDGNQDEEGPSDAPSERDSEESEKDIDEVVSPESSAAGDCEGDSNNEEAPYYRADTQNEIEQGQDEDEDEEAGAEEEEEAEEQEDILENDDKVVNEAEAHRPNGSLDDSTIETSTIDGQGLCGPAGDDCTAARVCGGDDECAAAGYVDNNNDDGGDDADQDFQDDRDDDCGAARHRADMAPAAGQKDRGSDQWVARNSVESGTSCTQTQLPFEGCHRFQTPMRSTTSTTTTTTSTTATRTTSTNNEEEDENDAEIEQLFRGDETRAGSAKLTADKSVYAKHPHCLCRTPPSNDMDCILPPQPQQHQQHQHQQQQPPSVSTIDDICRNQEGLQFLDHATEIEPDAKLQCFDDIIYGNGCATERDADYCEDSAHASRSLGESCAQEDGLRILHGLLASDRGGQVSRGQGGQASRGQGGRGPSDYQQWKSITPEDLFKTASAVAAKSEERVVVVGTAAAAANHDRYAPRHYRAGDRANGNFTNASGGSTKPPRPPTVSQNFTHYEEPAASAPPPPFEENGGRLRRRNRRARRAD